MTYSPIFRSAAGGGHRRDLAHLSAEELEGVIAHELAHMQNHDTLISAIATGFGLTFDARCSQGIDRTQR
ncbi:MAG: M48 family metalloprotease [Desulfuromonadales bacterium]